MKVIYFMLLVLSGIILSSCTKDNEEPIAESSSLTIVNAISGSTPLVTNFKNSKKLDYYRTAQQITAYGFIKYGGYVGSFDLGIYRFTDTTRTIYATNLVMEKSSIKTLYLAGTVAATDGFLIDETGKIPLFNRADSLIGLRLANLSSGSEPVSFTLRSVATTTIPSSSIVLESSLPYKGITDFKMIRAKSVDPVSYFVDIKNAATGVLITSFTLNALAAKLSKNQTLVLRGTIGGTGTAIPGSFLVNNY